VEACVEQLIGRVAKTLIECGRGAIRLDCRLDCRPAGCVDLRVGLFRPTASARHLTELARMQLERISLPGPVQAISVVAALTAAVAQRQEELFSDDGEKVSGTFCRDGPSGASHKRCLTPFPHLAVLVDRLSSRMGRQSVLHARLLADAQPELAYRYDPLLETRGWGETRTRRRGDTETGGRGDKVLLPRPLRLCREPIPLAPLVGLPDGPPRVFRSRGREHRVAYAWGPERIETGWWRGEPIARDYYRVETLAGQRFWLFRRLDDGRWFVHGMFE
jgi:protein ImuB